MQYRKMIIGGGVSFIVGALAFVFVFSYLAATSITPTFSMAVPPRFSTTS